MASYTVKITDRTPEKLAKLDAAIKGFVRDGSQHIERKLVQNVNEGGRSGKTYRRGKGATHQASAPGEFPKTDSGDLSDSIQRDIESNGLEARIGSAMEYAEYLETGTSRMAARPLWERTLHDEMPTLERLLTSAVESAR